MRMVGRIIAILVVVLVVAGMAYAFWPKPLLVDVASLQRGSLQVSVEAEGISRIREVFRITAPVAGRLVRVSMHAGDQVMAGETVATIEPAPSGLLDERSRLVAEASVASAEAAVQLAEVSLREAQSQLDYAKTERDRTRALAERGVASTSVEEQAELALNKAQGGVDAAEASLAMREQDLESARATLLDIAAPQMPASCCADVESPESGQVLTVINESEQIVQAGTPILELGNPHDMEISVDVLSSDAVKIARGAPATITDWGGPPLRARVASIDPTAATKVSALGIEEQRTEVKLNLVDPPQDWNRLGHGFRVVARIVVWEGRDRLLVPIAALFRQEGQWALFLVRDGKAELAKIEIGQRNDQYAEIIQGAELGDEVIVRPGDLVADGVAVEAAVRPGPANSAH